MTRQIALTAAILLTGCVAVEREFRAPLTLEYQCAQRPAPGEQGEIKDPIPIWPTLQALQTPHGAPPRMVQGRFEVLQSIPDPAWFVSDLEVAFVQLRILKGPDLDATGWLYGFGPFLAHGRIEAQLATPAGP